MVMPDDGGSGGNFRPHRGTSLVPGSHTFRYATIAGGGLLDDDELGNIKYGRGRGLCGLTA
jgi:hypothetical protein